MFQGHAPRPWEGPGPGRNCAAHSLPQLHRLPRSRGGVSAHSRVRHGGSDQALAKGEVRAGNIRVAWRLSEITGRPVTLREGLFCPPLTFAMSVREALPSPLGLSRCPRGSDLTAEATLPR